MKKKLLYRVAENEGLVFAPADRARLISQIHEAINNSRTWEQFRKSIPRKAYSEIIHDSFDDAGEPRPKGSDRFEGEMVAGWCDGDYPAWLQSEMGDVLPSEVLQQYGTLETTFINGCYWHLPPENCDAICDSLKVLGWELERAQNLFFM